MKKLTFTLFIALAVACLFSVPCNAKGKAKHVVFIGLDGWGSYSVPKADIPHIKQLMADGSYTLEKRTVLPSSSAVNWASMFMGAGPELHGYTQWGSKTPELPSRVLNQHGIFPTIFQLLRDARPEAEIGCLYEWDGIKYLVDTLALSHYAQAPDYNKHPEALCGMAEKYISERQNQLVRYHQTCRYGNADLLYYPLHLVCCPATAASALSRGIGKRCTGAAQVPHVLACHCGADRPAGERQD